MQCPECESRKIVKNGRRKDKQNYLGRNCNRQFIENYDQRGYSQEMKRHCLILYCNGMGFRGIERSTGVCHNTVINWVKTASSQISEENYEIPETAQLDELLAKLILWTNWLKKSGENPRRQKGAIPHLGAPERLPRQQGLAKDSRKFSRPQVF